MSTLAPAKFVAIDIGNSSTKLGWFSAEELSGGSKGANPLPAPSAVKEYPTASLPAAELVQKLSAEPVTWQVASVHREAAQRLEDWVGKNRPQDSFQLLIYSDLPLVVDVDFPARVGMDRLVAAVAAGALRNANSPAIVIDAGTAITVDLVTATGAFAGGVILPGFRLSAQALSLGTNQLPLAPFSAHDEPPTVIGKNTEAAIRSGLFWGTAGAVKELVERISQTLPTQPQIFVTGGDLWRLAPLLGENAKFIPNMVLSGIALTTRHLGKRPKA